MTAKRDCGDGSRGICRVRRLMEPAVSHPPHDLALARAFLALGDDPDRVPVALRPARRALAAAAAALVLALAGPLAWASAAPDPPVAAQKAEAPSPQADDEADGPSA